jgi:hypothetical protein
MANRAAMPRVSVPTQLRHTALMKAAAQKRTAGEPLILKSQKSQLIKLRGTSDTAPMQRIGDIPSSRR